MASSDPKTQHSLVDFIGLWDLHRSIHDFATGQTGTFRGTARFASGDGALNYHEAGEMRLGTGPALWAERRYLWRQGACGIEVYFDDGRFFHLIEPQPRPEADHWCDPDSYRVAYDFSDWPRWSARWTVTGPRKNYQMISDYRR